MKNGRSAKKLDRKMLKAGDLARQEDHRVKGFKAGEPDKIGGDITCKTVDQILRDFLRNYH